MFAVVVVVAVAFVDIAHSFCSRGRFWCAFTRRHRSSVKLSPWREAGKRVTDAAIPARLHSCGHGSRATDSFIMIIEHWPLGPEATSLACALILRRSAEDRITLKIYVVYYASAVNLTECGHKCDGVPLSRVTLSPLPPPPACVLPSQPDEYNVTANLGIR